MLNSGTGLHRFTNMGVRVLHVSRRLEFVLLRSGTGLRRSSYQALGFGMQAEGVHEKVREQDEEYDGLPQRNRGRHARPIGCHGGLIQYLQFEVQG